MKGCRKGSLSILSGVAVKSCGSLHGKDAGWGADIYVVASGFGDFLVEKMKAPVPFV